MQDDNIISDAQTDASQLNAPVAEGTVGSVPSDAMTLAEINAALGKNFTSKDAALKSWKDTNSYVGMKTEDIEKRVLSRVQETDRTNALAQELEEMRKERFYDKNPQFASPEVRSFIESTGKKPQEVVESEAFKKIFEKVSGYDETQKLKTVLESNPRVVASRDALSKARELSQSGGSKEAVEQNVVSAIKDAYGM